jgi:uncharacterized membrane protein
MWEKISRFYPPWMDLVPAMLLIFAVCYTYANYSLLPDQVPTHYGWAGTPDAWAPKSLASVYMLPIIGIIVWVSMTLTNYFLIMLPEDPSKCINLPQKKKDELGVKGMESIRTMTARGMFVLNLTVAAMLAALQYSSINTMLGLQNALGVTFKILTAALIVEAIGLSVMTYYMAYRRKR